MPIFLSCNFAQEELFRREHQAPITVDFAELEKGWLLVGQRRDPETLDTITQLRSDNFSTPISYVCDISGRFIPKN